MSNVVINPYEYFADPTKGRPIFNGFVYIGEPDTDPEVPANQKQVYARQEDGNDVAIPQPVLTNAGGYPTYNGSVVIITVQGSYSVKVNDKQGNQLLYQAVVSSSDATVTATPSGVSKTLGEWTEYLATPETIEVTASGTTTKRSLADRFGDVVNIVDFGAQVWPFDSTSAFAGAISTGASVIHIPSGIWKLTALPPLSSGQTLVGAGVDMWDHLDPNPLLKSWSRGTHLVFVGTGSKDKQLAYNNAGITSGGVLQNTDSINSIDTEYSLYNFYNTDGNYTQPATKKLFSAAVHVKPYATNVRLKDLRIVPNFNCMDGYIDGNTVDLSDDWGVGVFVDNAAWVELDNVQVVGYWRIAAVLVANKNDDAYLDTYGGANSAGRAYHSRIYNCVLQGHTGLMLRGGSVYKSLNVTSNSFEIEFDSSHFFSPFGTVSTPKGEFTYTSLSQSGSNIVFNGVTPDPVAAGLGNGPIRKGNSVGMGGITISKCLITGLDHSSGVLATSAYLSMSPSKALEIDGSFRMITFDMNYVQTKEDVLVHCHNVDDLRFIGGQIEANDYRLTPAGSYSATHGGRMLFSPQDTANTITNASGSSKVTFDRVHMAPYVDLFPFIDRDTDSKFASTGMFTPRTLVMTDEQFPDSDNLDIEGLNGQDVRIRAKSGNSIILRNVNGDNALRVSSAGTVLIENGPFNVNGGSATFSGGSVTISGGNLFVSSGKQLTFSGGGAFINKDAGQSLYLRTGTTIDVEITSSGVVKMPRLPTSAPAESGSLWNNGGILNIVT